MPLLLSVATVRSRSPLVALVLVLTLAACGGDGSLGPDGGRTALHFAAESREILVGESVELGSTLQDATGRPADLATIHWSSSEPGVLSVSDRGVAKGLTVGSTEVVASSGANSATMRLVVKRVPVASLTFQETATDLFVGDGLLLRAVPRDSAGHELLTRVVSYLSSDSTVATVSADGVLTTVGYGTVVVTAQSEGQSARLRFHVIARNVASVQLVPSALSIEVGESDQLWVVLRDVQGHQVGQRPLTFLTTDAGVAIVDGTGVVHGRSPGTAEIVVEVEGHLARATVIVWALEAVPGSSTGPPPSTVPAPPVAGGDGSRYQMTVRFLGPRDDRVDAVLDQAVSRWTSAVNLGVSDIDVDIAADACFDGQPAVKEIVDDLLVFVRVRDLDGEGGVLGRAGPCLIRTENGIPLLGLIELDRADLGRDPQVIYNVLSHELGHVMGIGTLWWYHSLVHDEGEANPLFVGETALSAYRALGVGDVFVPVENSGGYGTRDVHWRESTFRSELMTGYLNSGVNALSWLSIASLRDLGYSVDPGAAEAYSLPERSAVTARVVGGGTGVRMSDELILPRFTVDADGRVRRLP